MATLAEQVDELRRALRHFVQVVKAELLADLRRLRRRLTPES